MFDKKEVLIRKMLFLMAETRGAKKPPLFQRFDTYSLLYPKHRVSPTARLEYLEPCNIRRTRLPSSQP